MLLRSRQLRRTVRLLIDIISLFLAFNLSWALRFRETMTWLQDELYVTTFIVTLLLYLLVFIFYDNPRHSITRQGYFEIFVGVAVNQLILLGLLLVYFFATQQGGLVSRYQIGFLFVFNFFLDYFFRIFYRVFLIRFMQMGDNATRVMLVTVSWKAREIIERIREQRGTVTKIACITLLDTDKVGKMVEGIPVVGNQGNYLETHRQNVYDEVFIHIPYNFDFKLKRMILGFEEMGITVNLNVDIFNIDSREKRVTNYGDYQVISFAAVVLNPVALFFKRLMDILGGLLGFLMCGIFFVIFGPIIKFTSPGPILFAQTRVGINGRRFRIYKFRTMYQDAEERKKELMAQNEMSGLMFKMEDDPRITPVGKFLRKTSIDEFPQFWNVLKGDMSLVGTRPPTEDEYENYRNYHMRRLSIKPGITGMWQVYGRSRIKDFEEVVRLDLKYIDNWSLLLDVKLLFMTVFTVIFGIGAE